MSKLCLTLFGALATWHCRAAACQTPGVCTLGVSNFLEITKEWQDLVLVCEGLGKVSWVEEDGQRNVNVEEGRDRFSYRLGIGAQSEYREHYPTNRRVEEHAGEVKVEAKMTWDGVTLPKFFSCSLGGRELGESDTNRGVKYICTNGNPKGCKFTSTCEAAKAGGVKRNLLARVEHAEQKPRQQNLLDMEVDAFRIFARQRVKGTSPRGKIHFGRKQEKVPVGKLIDI